IPAQLRLMHLADVEVLRDQSALPALLARAGPSDVQLWSVSAVPPPRPEGNDPPAAPGVLVESQAGEARALEVRTLPAGIPTEAWAEALVAAASQLADQTRALVEAPGSLLTAGQLLPALLAGDPGDRAARPLAPGLHAGLLSDDGVRIEPVSAGALLTLGQFDDAFDRAVRNVDAL